jgi:hypothetical protein
VSPDRRDSGERVWKGDAEYGRYIRHREATKQRVEAALTLEQLAEWLRRLPASERVGVAGRACDCPLVHYAGSLGLTQVEVDGRVLRFAVPYGPVHYREVVFLPGSFADFVEIVDTSLDRRQAVRAEVALGIVEGLIRSERLARKRKEGIVYGI